MDAESEAKILKSIVMPDKPKLGSIGQWILFFMYFLFLFCVAILK